MAHVNSILGTEESGSFTFAKIKQLCALKRAPSQKLKECCLTWPNPEHGQELVLKRVTEEKIQLYRQIWTPLSGYRWLGVLFRDQIASRRLSELPGRYVNRSLRDQHHHLSHSCINTWEKRSRCILPLLPQKSLGS